MATTVILGSGIIGLSTAYYLLERQPGSSVHLVDSSSELFSSASGYAAGFLAKDWHKPSVTPLGELSFEEHKRLAEKEGGGRSGGMQGVFRDPLKLCQFLLEKCKAAGVHVHHPATALSIHTDTKGELSGIRIGYTDSSNEIDIPATRILLSAGVWTPAVFATLFKESTINIPVTSLAGHSLVVKTPKGRDADKSHAVFSTMDDAFSPEIFSRPSGVIYIAGLNSSVIPPPGLATDATPVGELMDLVKHATQKLIASDGELEIVREGLCFRPVTDRGTPFIGRFRDEQLGGGISTKPRGEGGVFLAVGHGPWGITLCLGTGKVVAELMHDEQLSANIDGLGL
ncbi:Putative oxidoreductase TDA3-like protein [Cladobotryum mycophilum]|uniref:Oxidoreductase TDA3-like protein n=1 Tax=Cladobotryum mycophilum TaxID=491253 RepID=A0ABR0SHJ1_9HYPO